ncbi:hypothetical protein OSTOST_24284 [Ostertagia ostertagi]
MCLNHLRDHLPPGPPGPSGDQCCSWSLEIASELKESRSTRQRTTGLPVEMVKPGANGEAGLGLSRCGWFRRPDCRIPVRGEACDQGTTGDAGHLDLWSKGPSRITGTPGADGNSGAPGQAGTAGSQGEKGICPKYCAIDGGVFFRGRNSTIDS